MTEEEIDDSVATLSYYSKGRFPPQWVETLGYRRRYYYMKWLRRQLNHEKKEIDKAMNR